MRQSSPKQNDIGFLAYWKDELEKLSSTHILHWAVDYYYPRLFVRTTFEPEGCVILSMLSNIIPKVTVLCDVMDYQMPYYWGVSKRFYLKTGLEIVPIHRQNLESFDSLPFDAVLNGTRREGCSEIRVLRMDQSMEIPSIAPLVRWTRDAVTRKLQQDAILDPSFINMRRVFSENRIGKKFS